MPMYPNEEVTQIRQRLLDGMADYMKGDGDTSWDCGYSQADIDRCLVIVDVYLAKVASGLKVSQDEIRNAVKKAVLDLNDLNGQAGGALIETDQREDLCALLLTVAQRAGLGTDEDITEEWREW